MPTRPAAAPRAIAPLGGLVRPAAPAVAPAVAVSGLAALIAHRDRASADAAILPTSRPPAANSEITAAAQSAVAAGEGYSPQEFLDDWQHLDAMNEDDVTDDDRAALLRKAVQRINELFAAEMAALRTGAANDLSMLEMSQMIKLAFVRVKESPAAWAMLDKTDRAAVIRGIIATAQKRNSAVKSRKPKDADALSASFSGAADVLDEAVDAFAGAFDGFSFGDM